MSDTPCIYLQRNIIIYSIKVYDQIILTCDKCQYILSLRRNIHIIIIHNIYYINHK